MNFLTLRLIFQQFYSCVWRRLFLEFPFWIVFLIEIWKRVSRDEVKRGKIKENPKKEITFNQKLKTKQLNEKL